MAQLEAQAGSVWGPIGFFEPPWAFNLAYQDYVGHYYEPRHVEHHHYYHRERPYCEYPRYTEHHHYYHKPKHYHGHHMGHGYHKDRYGYDRDDHKGRGHHRGHGRGHGGRDYDRGHYVYK